MKDYRALIKECLDEVEAVGIIPGNIKEWKINHRAKARWGMCTRKINGECIIEIAARLLTDDRISIKSCKETIIHEILHSCKDCNGHTGTWKKYAELINNQYGYNIKRVTSGKEKGIEEYESTYSLPYKYIFVCKYCGDTLRRKRMSKFTKYYRNYYCRNCGRLRAYQRYEL